MQAKLKSQQRLMAAAANGADFDKARDVRASMSLADMRADASGPMAGKPEHVKTSHPKRHLNLGKFLHKKKGGK